jgi:hypothetical protein
MKKFTLLLFFIPFIAISQVTNEGEPLSLKDDNVRTDKILLPDFDLQQLRQEDAINDVKGNGPWRFGYEHQVDFGLDTHGKWTNLEDGSRYWLLNISSPDAITMNFIFDEFYIPEGGKLYFYNADHTDILGAYTHTQNREDMAFGSWLVNGDDIFVELFEPADKIGESKLHMNKAVHGYRSVADYNDQSKSLNDSGPCNLDVDCSIGSDFDDKKEELKKSVAMTVIGNGFCSGTLINNTNNDGTPYFLTANHCLVASVSIWAFRFNWISPNPSCATFTNSTNGSFNQTASGSILRASNSKSDMALLEITAPLPEAWDLAWAGWDRSETVPEYTIGIHHPSGDIMKVCRNDDPMFKTQLNFNGNPSTDVWFISDWELGVTEPGSSGSALFDQNGRIVGQLAGGAAACTGTSNNGQFDFYGSFDESWDFGGSASSRLKDWLDPTDSGVLTLNSYPNNLSVDSFETIDISIYPNPVDDVINIQTNFENLTYELFDLSGKLILVSNKNQINVENLSKGIYLLKANNADSSQFNTLKVIIE